jgi:membrane protease YdiL (CAAX protease family)
LLLNYSQATRHPWSCLLFLLPLLAAYEGGIFYLGGVHAEALRTGTDAWMRTTLGWLGVEAMFALPALIIAVFLGWSWWRWQSRPSAAATVWAGMTVESVLFALLLWCAGRAQEPVMDQLGMAIPARGRLAILVGQSGKSIPPTSDKNVQATPESPTAQAATAVSFVGAGIYEEFLFRLLLYPLLLVMISFTGAPRGLSILLAMLLSAILFAAAHHVGPYGEVYEPHVFVFRLLAGLYFVALFQFRGFGIAVGAHACYDLLVGLAMA